MSPFFKFLFEIFPITDKQKQLRDIAAIRTAYDNFHDKEKAFNAFKDIKPTDSTDFNFLRSMAFEIARDDWAAALSTYKTLLNKCDFVVVYDKEQNIFYILEPGKDS